MRHYGQASLEAELAAFAVEERAGKASTGLEPGSASSVNLLGQAAGIDASTTRVSPAQVTDEDLDADLNAVAAEMAACAAIVGQSSETAASADWERDGDGGKDGGGGSGCAGIGGVQGNYSYDGSILYGQAGGGGVGGGSPRQSAESPKQSADQVVDGVFAEAKKAARRAAAIRAHVESLMANTATTGGQRGQHGQRGALSTIGGHRSQHGLRGALSPHRMLAGFAGAERSVLQRRQSQDQRRHERERRRADYQRRTLTQSHTSTAESVSSPSAPPTPKASGVTPLVHFSARGGSHHRDVSSSPSASPWPSSSLLGRGGITATVDVLSAAGVGAMRRAMEARVASVKKLQEKCRGEAAAVRPPPSPRTTFPSPLPTRRSLALAVILHSHVSIHP